MDNKLNGLKILVTGGKGYLGSFLVQALKKENADVYLFAMETPENDKEFQVDIRDAVRVEEVVKQIQPDIVYHLAASIDRSRDFAIYNSIMDINVNGTLNLLNALLSVNCRNIIFTSSSEVYGNNQSPFHEEQIVNPASPYSLSKLYGENLIKTFSAIYDKNYTILRLFNFYGRSMPENFFIPQVIQTLKRNEDFLMTQGEQIRDFLYVEDVILALLMVAKNERSYKQTFNVCSGEGISIGRLAEIVASKLNNSRGKVILGALSYRENEIWEMIGDNNKIHKELGFEVKTSLEQGIEKCLKD